VWGIGWWRRIRPRRSRCRTCGRTHVLSPVNVLWHRRDDVSVIGEALTRSALGEGFRSIARCLARPEATVRGWIRRMRRLSEVQAREVADVRWKESDLVFTTKYGTPIEPRNLNRAFDSHCKNAGVPRIRVHDTRHTCASLLAALDVHPRVAMRILRHSQISVTMNVYTQIPSPETRKALDRLNASLDRENSDP
jgi:hypothetical protein